MKPSGRMDCLGLLILIAGLAAILRVTMPGATDLVREAWRFLQDLILGPPECDCCWL